MKSILEQVYGVKLSSQKIELAETKKVQGLLKKYKSLKNLDRGYYDNKLQQLKADALKNIEVLGDIKDESPKYLSLLKEIGADADYKELSNLLMSVKEDFDVMVEIVDLIKRF